MPSKRAEPRAAANTNKAQPVLKTLDRILSKAGLGSRTDARGWIAQGRVTVNGKRATSAEQWVDPARDKVRFDGKPVVEGEKLYVLLYKPTGYLTTYRDPEGRPTIYQLLPEYDQFLANVGRLDLDTSGLLILTNDTQFANHVSSPESHVPKTYLVKAAGLLTDAQLQQLRDGVDLSDGPARPAQVKFLRHTARQTFLEITITEGRNRQVRRMIEALGSHVMKLVRTAIGPIEIAGLEIGKHRRLTAAEVKVLQRVHA